MSVSGVQYQVAIGWTGPERRSAVRPHGKVVYLPEHRSPRNRAAERELAELNAALRTVAELVVANPIYSPIFDRLECEIAAAEAKLVGGDPIAKARAIAAARRKN